MELQASVPAPAAPKAAPAAVVAETVKVAEPVKAAEPKKEKPMRESMQEAIGRRFKEEEAKTAEGRKTDKATAPVKAEPVKAVEEPTKPAEATKVVDPKKPLLPVKKAEPAKEHDDSDDAIKAEIEVKTKDMTGAQKQAFADLRYEQRDMRRELKDLSPKVAKAAALELEIAALKKTPGSSVEVEELKAKLEKATARDAEREQELMAAKVERTDAYQNAVTKPMASIKSLVARLAKKYEGVSEQALTNALHDTSDKQSDLLIAAVDGMNDIEKQQVYQAALKVTDINEKAEVLHSQATEAMAKIDAKKTGETEAQKQAATKARNDAHAGNWKALQEAIPSILTPMEGDAADVVVWNEAQTNAEVFARDTDFAAQEPKVQSELMQRAAVYPLLIGAVESFETQLKEEKAAHVADLAELNKFRAKVPGAASDRSVEVEDPARGKKGFVERVSERFAAAGY